MSGAETPTPAEIEAAILTLLAERRAGASICPSEAARRLAPADWRPLMSRVRATAATMAEAGRLEITRKGKPIDPATVRGVIRLRLPPL